MSLLLATLAALCLGTAVASAAVSSKRDHFGPYVPRVPCPLSGEPGMDDPIALTNAAIDGLVPEGRLEEAVACCNRAIKDMRASGRYEKATLESVEGNANAIASGPLAVWHPGSRRLYHTIGGRGAQWPHSDTKLVPGRKDQSIQVFDGAFTAQQCESFISLFERSELFEGNVMSNGQVFVDANAKKRWEFDISGAANGGDETWAAMDRLATSVMTKYLIQYAKLNPGVSVLRNPLGEEGWRMNRYHDNGQEHHAYHIDAGQEPKGTPQRVLAAILYLSSVEQGGETVFLNQGVAVEPKCGRMLIFPSTFTHVHAGRRVRKGTKYMLTLMINS